MSWGRKSKTLSDVFSEQLLISRLLLSTDPNIQEYLNNLMIQNNENFYGYDSKDPRMYFTPSPKSMSFQSSSLDDQISEGNINEDLLFTAGDYNSVNNANLLKDIESLIQNMERKQTQDNDSVMLRNIDNILSNIKLNESRPHSPQSNLSAEPIRMKSPIMLPTRSDDKTQNDVRDIIDDIRSFVSNNIQDIVPDLVGQVELELTSDLHDESYDIAMANLDEFLRHRREAEFEERNVSTGDLRESSLEDFFRHRHDEEFDERNVVEHRPPSSSDASSSNHDIHDFFRDRQDEEFLERNNDFHNNEVEAASHDSITDVGVNDHNPIVAASSGSEEADFVNNPEASPAQSRTNEALQASEDFVEASDGNQQLEALKYKSSYNLKILKQPSKRPRSERNFKKRNSLMLENVLLGRRSFESRTFTSTTVINDAENNINHSASENIESAPNLNEINVEVEDVRDINESIAAGGEQSESLLPAETPLFDAVETTINDEIELTVSVIDDESEAATTRVSHQDVIEAAQSVSMSTESEATKAPQNLSELVEDTQRLIKQMKDEINAIYVSDDELSSSERSDYSEDDWADGYGEEEEEEDEYTDEYEEWTSNGEFIESDNAPDGNFTGESFAEDSTANIPSIVVVDTAPSIETESFGDAPTAVNEPENVEAESVVHGKLELAPMSSNQLKADANIGSTLNDNGSNLNNLTSLQANDETDTQASSSSANHNESINNETKAATNSIKEIVNEAINDVISAISSDNIVSHGSDNDESQIAGGPQSSNEPDMNAIDSVMNNSENPLAEVMSKVYDSGNDSITSGSISNVEVIISGSMVEEETSNVGIEMLNNENEVKNDAVMVDGENDEDDDEAEKPLVVVETNSTIEAPVVSLSSGIESAAIIQSSESSSIEAFAVIQSASTRAPIDVVPSSIEMEITDGVSNDNIDNLKDINEATSIINVASSSSDNPNISQLEASNLKPKGAVAKSKIPAKVKIIKRKDSTADDKKTDADDAQASSKNKSKSSSPEKIKEGQTGRDDGPKQPQATRKNSLESTRKSSFDNGPRKKSVGAPFGLLASSNVKNLQSQFLNKSNVPAPPKAQPTKLKPAKLTTPKSLSKEPASSFANKLTKLITPSTSSVEKSNPIDDNATGLQLRDHSKDVVPEKKYLEHCFSDDYSTTDDECEEDMKAPKSFFNKKPTQDSDDETSDVRRRIAKTFFFTVCDSGGGAQMYAILNPITKYADNRNMLWITS